MISFGRVLKDRDGLVICGYIERGSYVPKANSHKHDNWYYPSVTTGVVLGFGREMYERILLKAVPNGAFFSTLSDPKK